MKTTFKMKEAANKEQAIISILDVLEENPLWLNKCTSQVMALLISIKPGYRKSILKNATFDLVQEIFIEMKTQHYEFEENKYEPKGLLQWN